MFSEFVSLIKTLAITSAVFSTLFLVFLSLPQSRLRRVALECLKYVCAAGLLVLMPSPVDLVPDVIPLVGWTDDVGYLLGAAMAVSSGLRDRKQRQFELACENARLAREAGLIPQSNEGQEGVA